MGWRPANPSLSVPVRAAYYFPWYNEGWDQLGYRPFTRYTPSLGAYYDQTPDLIAQHLEWAKYANIDVLVPTWRGRQDGTGITATTMIANPNEGQRGTDEKIRVLLDLALQYGVKVAVYYEVEGYSNPTASQIKEEFAYLANTFFAHPAYCRVNNTPVVFVYSPGEGSAMLQRYSDATDGFQSVYITAIYTDGSTPEPQGRHSFSADREKIAGNSFTVLPGFWRPDEVSARTPRDLTAWQTNVQNMVNSGKDWHIIISFNEWGEGSMVEPTVEFGTDYLDVLHDIA